MNSHFTPGSRCWLDGTTEVIVLKAITRSFSTYNVEIPGKSFETVAQDRLTLIDPLHDAGGPKPIHLTT